MMIVAAVVALLMGFAWHFYFSGRETMRHTVSQSQVQADTRIILDQLETEMTGCYAFSEVDSEKKKFGFYAFTYSKVPLDEIYYDTSGTARDGQTEKDARIMVARYEYEWREDGSVLKRRTPGWLYFLQTPMKFVEGDGNTFDAHTPFEKVVLRDIADFEVRAYSQEIDQSSDSGTKITPLPREKSEEAAFIVLRLHTKVDEAGNRRDEELDIVTKFYSSTRLAEITNPGYFCSTDRDGKF
jgi:hypothetical protein